MLLLKSWTPTKDLTESATSTNQHEPSRTITNHESKHLLCTKFPFGLLGGARRTVGWLPWTPGKTRGINVNELLPGKCDQYFGPAQQLQIHSNFRGHVSLKERFVDSTLLFYDLLWSLVIPKCVSCLVSLAVLGCWSSSLEILTAQHVWSLEELHRFRDFDDLMTMVSSTETDPVPLCAFASTSRPSWSPTAL